jgi:hypothetical protein
MDEMKHSANVGDYLVVEMVGVIGLYIVEVIRAEPLRVKFKDCDSMLSSVKEGEIIIDERATALFQQDVREDTDVFITSEIRAGRNVRCGLKNLGIEDGEFHYMLPRVLAG